MTKTYEFKFDNMYMDIDLDDLTDEYMEYCKDYSHISPQLRDWVAHWFSGLDDCYYYCDNGEEIIDDITKEIEKRIK